MKRRAQQPTEKATTKRKPKARAAASRASAKPKKAKTAKELAGARAGRADVQIAAAIAKAVSSPSGASTAREVQQALASLADPQRAKFLQRFFKTGPGEYAEGDRLRGLTVPQIRLAVREAGPVATSELAKLLKSDWHEDRLAGLLIAVRRSARAKATEDERRELHEFYLAQAKAGRINNWDLVDVTVGELVGRWLADRPADERARVLDRLACSRNLWERRIAMVATQQFIRAAQFADALRIATTLRDDKHDLIHKAVGWMLREIGQRDRLILDSFLTEHVAYLPRTALRYAIEKHSPAERQKWLSAPRPR